MQKYFILFLFACLSFLPSHGQAFFRISGDYSIKAKTADGAAQLIMGKFYYDRTVRKIVYLNSFPEKEAWVSSDTSLYKLIGDNILSRQTIPPAAEFSIFHLSLSSQLANFGLKNSAYKIGNVERDKGRVITTWEPPSNLAHLLGSVMISNEKKKLQGIVFFNTEGVIVKRQFFEDYKNFSGLQFPGTVIEILYDDGKENYRKTTYTNIKVDELENNHLYNYPIPRI